MADEVDYHQKKRDIRRQYRALTSETQKNRHELINPESTAGLHDVLDRANRLFDDVKLFKGTREAAMDSAFLVIASSLGKQSAQKLHTDLVMFDPREYVEKLKTYLSGRSLENTENRNITVEAWRNLGKEARLHFRKAPASHSLLGSFGHDQPKKDRQIIRKKDKEIVPTAVPKQLTSVVQSHQEVTTEEVGKIMAILQQYTNCSEGSEVDPVSFFEFVINPQSFGQTIENIFYVSFLVKDGHVKVELDGDGLPVIFPCEPYKEGQSRQAVGKKQFMFSLTMEKWREIIEVMGLEEPLIPTRDE
ncbi:non-structural maintenance of chromosomes element 4 homolog A-like [Antedon mediterranea]|uniref:non-structural maintenance of chromosomes element 4 homolog A-like n=1 Tax=Antedon mediterranea TaxID=105859 RepID=UPI003AF6A6BB